MIKIILILFVLLVRPSYCQDKNDLHDSISSGIVIDFKIPKEWVQINKDVYVLKDYNNELNNLQPYLKQGDMPWRHDPKYFAVTCLWSFGISDWAPVDDFAKKLIEIKKR
jgi:hypothetical protein